MAEDVKYSEAMQAVAIDIESRVLDIVKNPDRHRHRDLEELKLCCFVTVYGRPSETLMEIHRHLAPLPEYERQSQRPYRTGLRCVNNEDRRIIKERFTGVTDFREQKRLRLVLAEELGLTVHQVSACDIGIRLRGRRR